MVSLICGQEVNKFIQCYDNHHLIVYVKKTGLFSDPGHLGDHSLLFSHSYIYLYICTYLVHIDYNLSRGVPMKCIWSIQQDPVAAQTHGVWSHAVRYGMATWGGKLTVKLKADINKLVCTAFKGMGVREHPTLQQLLEKTVVRQARKINADPLYVLCSQGCFYPINVTWVPITYKRRYLNS